MHYQLSSDTVFVKSADNIVLLEMGEGKYFELKGAVMHVFDMLHEGASGDAMIAEISTHFAIDRALAEADFRGVMDRLIAANLVDATG